MYSVLAVVVSLICFYFVMRSVSLICKHGFSWSNNERVWESLKGQHCLIVNCASEESFALCNELVERGMKLVMIGDKEEVLNNFRRRVRRPSKVYLHIVDFSGYLDFSFIEKYNIGLFINNLKFPPSKPEHFIDQKVSNMVDVCLRGQLQLTKVITCTMMDRNKGYVLNIGYSYSLHPMPYRSMMSAINMAYKAFSAAMYYELLNYNVNFEYMDVGTVTTSASKNKTPTLFAPSLEVFAKQVLNKFGSSYFTVPYFPHFLEFLIIQIFPSFLVARFRKSANEDAIRNHPNKK